MVLALERPLAGDPQQAGARVAHPSGPGLAPEGEERLVDDVLRRPAADLVRQGEGGIAVAVVERREGIAIATGQATQQQFITGCLDRIGAITAGGERAVAEDVGMG